MDCPGCKSKDVHRSRRKNWVDHLKASMGRWPFACRACGRRFTAAHRYVPSAPAEPKAPMEKKAEAGPAMAFRREAFKPTAKVVIQADDTVQLDQILMDLHRAVSYYQQPSSREREHHHAG